MEFEVNLYDQAKDASARRIKKLLEGAPPLLAVDGIEPLYVTVRVQLAICSTELLSGFDLKKYRDGEVGGFQTSGMPTFQGTYKAESYEFDDFAEEQSWLINKASVRLGRRLPKSSETLKSIYGLAVEVEALLRAISVARRGKPTVAEVLYRGCAERPNGNAPVDFRLSTLMASEDDEVDYGLPRWNRSKVRRDPPDCPVWEPAP